MNIKIKLKRPDQKSSALYTEFSRNKIPLKFYTGKTIQCKNWSESKQEVLSKEENYQLINNYLEQWKSELSRIIAQMEANRQRLNQKIIKAKLDSYFKKDNAKVDSTDEVNDFISYFQHYYQKIESDQKDKYRLPQTKMHVILAFNLLTKKHLAEFKSSRSKDTMSINLKADFKLHFEDININFIEKFKEYFEKTTYTRKIKGVYVTRHYTNNYAFRQMKTLKQVITTAIEAKYVQAFTWNTVKSEGNETDSVYTDFDEIQQLLNLDLEDKTEIEVRDKYVLNCFLGMRYSDLNKVDSHCFSKRTISGKEYIVYTGRMKKTGHRIEFALHSTAQEILEKYNYQLPKINVLQFNSVLKQIAFKAGWTGLERVREIRGGKHYVLDYPKFELMSSHAGRRSFCTNFYNEAVAIAAIMSISGHQTEKEFRRYIKKASVRLEIVAEQISAIKPLALYKTSNKAA